ncbi:hypothetical protein [Listeria phage 20422-1]|uniref:Uncharacterized protein n=3 Tax=Pecentumvirus LP048 TaxID=2560557 RepID=A0A5C2ICN6_9CAUD|nr:hypothetical protein LP048_026 [Listeria phage LP-048]AHL19699.1 hypothetical protein LP048_026 [Listeria phage LP-048]QEP53022.2 hypothetical protein FK485_0022 [Listeria phage LP-039]QNL31789.1 hypothetical protein HUK29_0022 [Listeria phage LP-Mix_6.1]
MIQAYRVRSQEDFVNLMVRLEKKDFKWYSGLPPLNGVYHRQNPDKDLDSDSLLVVLNYEHRTIRYYTVANLRKACPLATIYTYTSSRTSKTGSVDGFTPTQVVYDEEFYP